MENLIVWKASKDKIRKHISKLAIFTTSGIAVLFLVLVFSNFFEYFEKTIASVLIVFIVASFILIIYLNFRNLKKLENGRFSFEIRKDGIRLLSGRFIPKEDVEFVFIDLNPEKWATIKTRNTPPMNINEKLLSDYKKFFFSIPWRDRLRNDFEHSLIPNMDEFIEALKKCEIDVYICKEGRKKVEKVV